jgi:membrane protease YdiL (CAAX protease family)
MRPARLGPRAALALTVAVLAGYHEARRLAIPDSWHGVTNTAMIGVFAGIAVAAGCTARELGLGSWRRGVRAGGIVAGAAAVVTAIAALSGADPTGRVEAAAELSGREVLVQVFAEIPIATVVLEELAFRGVLFALLARLVSPRTALVVGSVLFGIWHVSPPAVVSSAVGGELATVAATTGAGVVFHLLRRRTDSLAAPAVAHWGTNGVTLGVAWLLGR